MEQLTRQEFFQLHRHRPQNSILEIQAPSDLAIAQPIGSGLNTFTGTWDQEALIHLLRRTSFGVRKEDVDYFSNKPMLEVVDEILYTPYKKPALPINDYNDKDFRDPRVHFGKTWINDYYWNENEGARVESLRAWWIRLMIMEQRSIHEKMTLFWHNHIPIEFYAVFYGAFLYRYLDTLQENALGNFKTIAKKMTLDGAMLNYLNGNENSKSSPDENYAREIQELFVIGKDLPEYFTEEDVRAAARLLTGWRIDWEKFAYYFDENQHDTTPKQFSSFYGNRLIQGKNGKTGGMEELDEFLDMLFAHPEPAKYLCRKLYRYFVYHEINEATEQNIIEPLANILRDNNYEILPVLDVLLKSEHFYDILNRGAIIKSPLDLCLGMYRQFNINLPNETNLRDRFLIPLYTAYNMGSMLQIPGEPPNVAGWQAYYQKPILDKVWVNTSSLPKRVEFAEIMLYYGYYGDTDKTIIDVLSWAKSLSRPDDVNALIEEAIALLLGITLDENIKTFLKNILLSDLPSEYYWTIAWNEWLDRPDDEMARGAVEVRLKSFVWWLLQSEEYQLM